MIEYVIFLCVLKLIENFEREREKEIILEFNCTQFLRGLLSLVRSKFSLVYSFEQNYKLKEVDSSLRDGFCSID